MPIIKSAKRAIRQSGRRRVFNLRRTRAMQSAVRAAKDAKEGKESVEAQRLAYKAIDKAVKRGVIKKNAAARKKSQIAKLSASKK